MSKIDNTRKKRVKVCASLLAADFRNLVDSIKAVEDAGCDEIHFDVMDGNFVPNLSFGPQILETISKVTKLPIEVHMMVKEPGRFVQEFSDAGGTLFTIHFEACTDINQTLGKIIQTGMKAGIALKPGTPADSILGLLSEVRRILIMTVEPGFGGQQFLVGMLDKIAEIKKIVGQDDGNLDIGVDGGIKIDTAQMAVQAGANTLISGTGLFNYPDGLSTAVRLMRQ